MTRTVHWEPDQWGAYTIVGGDWTDVAPDDTTGDLTVQDGISSAGVIFDAATGQSIQSTTVDGIVRPMDPPIIGTGTLNFSVTRVGGSSSPWSIDLYLLKDPAPEDYSDSLVPLGRGEVLLGSFSLGTVPVIPTTAEVSLELNSTQMDLIRAFVVGSARWSGRLALAIVCTAGAGRVRLKNGDSFPFQFTTTQTPFFSGLGKGFTPGARAVRDTRMGIPTLSSRLVRDEQNQGLWVRASDQDPEDQPTRYVPDPHEGVVDDEVPG